MTTPTFTLLPDYGEQYGIVLYTDGSYGACNVNHYEPAGNSDPNIPFTGLTLPFDPGDPAQEGSQLAWATKANNMLGRTYSTAAEAEAKLHEVVGGVHELGVDVFEPANNPFKDQFTKSDFPDGFDDSSIWRL